MALNHDAFRFLEALRQGGSCCWWEEKTESGLAGLCLREKRAKERRGEAHLFLYMSLASRLWADCFELPGRG